MRARGWGVAVLGVALGLQGCAGGSGGGSSGGGRGADPGVGLGGAADSGEGDGSGADRGAGAADPGPGRSDGRGGSRDGGLGGRSDGSGPADSGLAGSSDPGAPATGDARDPADSEFPAGPDGGARSADQGPIGHDIGPAPTPRDPLVLVHGYLGRGANWDRTIAGLVARGWARDRIYTAEIPDTNQSIRTQASAFVAPLVERVRRETGAARVDLVGHSLGGVVARLYVFEEGGEKVRDFVSVAASHHGNASACITRSIGASSDELCPAYASEAASVAGLQWQLNGDPDRADVDETPFGVEEGGGIRWNAIALSTDFLIVTPHHVSCLDQRHRGDCSAPLNRVIDWPGLDHARMIGDDRVIDLLATMLHPEDP